MKIKIKQLAFFIGLLLVVTISACEKNDKDADFGLTYVYMPQALVSNLSYPVPAGNDVSNYNYTIDDTKVNVRLGVLRSGSAKLQSYAVNVTANPDTVTALLTKSFLDATTVLMPAGMYTLPTTVTVPDGQAGTGFLLSLDKAQVKTYAGKKLALGVVISSPTKYSINNTINKVVVIVNVDALKLP